MRIKLIRLQDIYHYYKDNSLLKYVPQQRYRELVIDSIYKDIDLSEIVTDHEIGEVWKALGIGGANINHYDDENDENIDKRFLYRYTDAYTFHTHDIYVREEFKEEFEEKFLTFMQGGIWGSWTKMSIGGPFKYSMEYTHVVDTIVDYTLLVGIPTSAKSDPDLHTKLNTFINEMTRIHSPPSH